MQRVIEGLHEIELKEPEDFLKIKETLTRIGVANRRDKKLFQTAHILHKRGRLYIVHFKQMFLLDGKEAILDEDDKNRLTTIVRLLERWGLLSIVDERKLTGDSVRLDIVPYREKRNWQLISKYTIGK